MATHDEDDTPQLSPEAMAALREFLGDRALQQQVSAEVHAFQRDAELGDVLTARMATADYWETRYRRPDEPDFEWLASWEKLSSLCEDWLGDARHRAGPTLVVGCGTSRLTEEMHKAGWKNIVSTDISPTVIARMAARCPAVRWVVDDIRKMGFADMSFETVFDKATLDALLADKSQQDEDGVCPDVAATLNEVARVLRPGGTFVWISFGRPKAQLLRRQPWSNALKLIDRRHIGEPGCISFEAYLLQKVTAVTAGAVVIKAVAETSATDEELAQLITAAFTDLQTRSGLPEDLADIEGARAITANHERNRGVVALDVATGKIVGANWLTEDGDAEQPRVHGLGPVSVSPSERGRGIGRKLVQAVLDMAAHDEVFLLVDGHNVDALSLYLSLGFLVVSEPLLLVSLKPECFANAQQQQQQPTPEFTVIRLEQHCTELIDQCCDLMKRATGFTRRNDLIRRSANGTAWVALDISTNRVAAFCSGLEIDNHSVGSSQSALIAVLSMAATALPETKKKAGMFVEVPTGLHQLVMWALHCGRIQKTVLHMHHPGPHANEIIFRNNATQPFYLPSIEM